MTEIDLDILAAELVEFAVPKKKGGRSAREERIISGFEEIQRFFETFRRAPQHGEDRDIFERLYAVRLDRIRGHAEYRELVAPIDHQGLLAPQEAPTAASDEIDTDELLAALEADLGDLTDLRHVRTNAEKKAAEEIASRQRCEDFDRFKPIFEQVQHELDTGLRATRPFERKAEIEVGRFFVVGGQKAYVAEKGEMFTQDYGDRDARLRLIFDNGTESNMLMRSLQRALNDDPVGRRITEAVAGPLFAAAAQEGDEATGTIYVLRSKSNHPTVTSHRDLVHKIGVTGGDLSRRIANAKLDPTFLMAEVEIVATYELYNINRTKLENLIHRLFAPARLDIEIRDRFGKPVAPREWFLVPLYVIEDAVDKIREGTIAAFTYDPQKATLIERDRPTN